jgi:rfaE bifunctional protein kinase chain/domain
MHTPIQPILALLSEVRILVLGDVMLDRYWFGDVARISPEAPVPIAHIKKQQNRLGGAANVARNLADLGVQVSLLSVVGKDEAGDEVARLIEEAGIRNHLWPMDEVRTTIKLRVLARHQQLIRLDFEEPPKLDALAVKHEDFIKLLPEHDVIIFSDYGKGSLEKCQSLIQQALAAGKKVLVDPKGTDYSIYTGAHVITPNRKELSDVIGAWQDEFELHQRAQALRKKYDFTAILLTRSEEGMSLFTEQEDIHQNTRALEVFDVSGAGDTVIATLGAVWGAGAPLVEAMHLANIAAGCVVGKLGAATCSLQELNELMEQEV